MEFLNDDLDILDIIENGIPRRMYNRVNHFVEMDNLMFFQRFRLTRETVVEVILPQIEKHLEFEEDCLPTKSVVDHSAILYHRCAPVIGCRFYGNTYFYSIQNIQKNIVLASFCPRYIRTPQNEEIIQVQNCFFQIASFPQVIRCIDGSHIHIHSPGRVDGEIFRNRKGDFSINVQMIGDSDLQIRDLHVGLDRITITQFSSIAE